jgi:hypothetical protein
MKIIPKILLAVVITSQVGCASITGTTGQSISVEAKSESAQISGADCEMTNSKGKWFLKTPGSVQVRRSSDDLIVICSKKGFEAGQKNVVSQTKGAMFGNIVLGGGIGALVDHNTGAAYEYPTLVQIFLNKTDVLADSTTGTEAIGNGGSPGSSVTKLTPELAEQKCSSLGFTPGKEDYARCVLRLAK